MRAAKAEYGPYSTRTDRRLPSRALRGPRLLSRASFSKEYARLIRRAYIISVLVERGGIGARPSGKASSEKAKPGCPFTAYLQALHLYRSSVITSIRFLAFSRIAPTSAPEMSSSSAATSRVSRMPNRDPVSART